MSRSIHREPLALVPQYFGSLIFDRRNSRYAPFDQAATDLLINLIDRRIDQVLTATPNSLHDATLNFFEHFQKADYFSIDGRLMAETLEVTPPQGHLTGPLAAHLEIIGACNLTCKHCFAGVLPRNQNPITLKEMDQLFGELAAIGCYRLGLTGGEPMLRKDLFEIIDLAVEHGLHPCLTTNGLLIDEEAARKFAQREMVWLNISLDGATAQVNDSIRGGGTYDQVLEKIRILKRHSRFTLAFTLTSKSVSEIEECAELARQLGAHTAVFRPMYPVGVGQQHMDLMPSFESYTDALTRLENSLRPSEDLRGIDPFSPQLRAEQNGKVQASLGCGAGNTIATISVQGDVNPCSFLGAGHNAGSIREDSFREIWDQSAGFQKMRALSGTACSDKFQGGCRARAQLYNGHHDAPDPWHDAFQNRKADSTARHPLTNVQLVQLTSGSGETS